MTDIILVINAGSSSLKFEVFEIRTDDALHSVMEGQVSGIGTRPRFAVRDVRGDSLIDETYSAGEVADVEAAQDLLGGWLTERGEGQGLIAVGHRVVHGGVAFAAPVLVDDAILKRLDALAPLAPLHQPANLGPIRSIRRRQPMLPQIACFDTAFHRGHPEVADRFAIPEEFYAAGVRRYGFHGLSYEYIAGMLPTVAPDIAAARVLVAHLGSGSSLCALVGGRSVESTMGFTALDGLPMGTRPGQLDAGVVLWLLREQHLTAPEIEHLLYHDCGLKGLSGISGDVRDLLASPEPRAGLALEFFVYRIAQMTGALTAAMGGIDGFVFTAGIGENSPEIRAAVAGRLGWLGLELDPDANA